MRAGQPPLTCRGLLREADGAAVRPVRAVNRVPPEQVIRHILRGRVGGSSDAGGIASPSGTRTGFRRIAGMDPASGDDAAATPVSGHETSHPSRGDEAFRTSSAAGGLGDQEVAILEFEAGRPGLGQAGDQEIRDRFAMSTTRYFQLLNQVLDHPDALAHDPVLVARLRRVRDDRRRARSAVRLPS